MSERATITETVYISTSGETYETLGLMSEQGSMSITQFGYRQSDKKKVVIKTPYNSQHLLDLSCFEHERDALIATRHENLVNLVDHNIDCGRPFLALEHVTGITLATYIDRNSALDLHEVPQVLFPVASALDELHKNMFIHGDVKPENIILENSNLRLPVLYDLGFSRHFDEEQPPGLVQCTPEYAALEQLRGGVHKSSDIYALSITVYALLTGQMPFESNSVEEITREKISGRLKKLSQVRAGLPPRIEKVLGKGASRYWDDRHTSAMDFMIEFEDAIHFDKRKLNAPYNVVMKLIEAGSLHD